MKYYSYQVLLEGMGINMETFKKKYIYKFCLGGLLFFTLWGCQVKHATHPTSIQEIKATLDKDIAINKKREYRGGRHSDYASIRKSVMPSLSGYLSEQSRQKRFDVVANQLPAKEFFMGLVAGTPQNIMIHPSVSGLITLNLKNVTLPQALEAARDLYGYEYRRTSYGYEIMPPELQTRLFSVNYLDIQRTGRSYTQITTGQVSDLGTITTGGGGGSNSSSTSNSNSSSRSASGAPTSSMIETRSEMKFWDNLGKTIRNIIGTGEGRRITVNTQSGIIAVRAYPKELNNVYRFINQMQSSINRQVILEAKVLEVVLSDLYQSGVDWGALRNPLKAPLDENGLPTVGGMGQFGNNSFANTELNGLSGIFAINVKGNFSVLIQLLQSQGNVQVLSSPHISTVNNQKAVIKVGTDSFFVTGVSTTNSVVGTTTLPSQDVSLTPFFSGITLDVTPEISGDETVILHIHPSVSMVKEQTKNIQLGSTTDGQPNTLSLPLAASEIRETDTVVRAKNGQVVVIGGLMQNNMQERIVGTPWASKIPFLGTAFRRTEQVSVKSELIILLRPIIVTNRAEINRLEKSREHFNDIDRPFHAGGLTNVFGNEGERYENGPRHSRVIYKDTQNV